MCELGSRPIPTGSVLQVRWVVLLFKILFPLSLHSYSRVLGILGLIDSGETDWKVNRMEKKDGKVAVTGAGDELP